MLEGMWWASYAALWVLILLEMVMTLALARQVGLLHTRLRPTGARMGNVGLELGELAPSFSKKDLNGRLITLGVEHGRPTLLIFLSPGCSICADLVPGILTLYQHEREYTEIIVISLLKDEAENQAFVERHRLGGVPYVISPEIGDNYHVPTAPYAMLVDSEGKIKTKGLVNNLEHLESLLNTLDEGYPSYDSKMNTLIALQNRSS